MPVPLWIALELLLLVSQTACARVTHTYSTTVDSCHNEREPILNLPNLNETLQYWKVDNDGLQSQWVHVTKGGHVYLLTPLIGWMNKRLDIAVKAVDTVTLEHTQIQVIVYVAGASFGCKSRTAYRTRRAVRDISVTVDVLETATNVLPNYANAGVIEDSDNRFYLVENDGIPFSSLGVTSGALVVSATTPMDYETAQSHQYTVTVFVNNTRTSDEYRVQVTVRLIDVNDETPVFTMEPRPYLATADPNQPPNSMIDYLITVSDSDASSSLVFSLVEGNSKFRVTQDGELFSTDRLSSGVTYEIKVKVEDVNTDQNSPSTEAVIKILAGQRPPQFYQSHYQISIPENGQGAELGVVMKAKSFQGDVLSFTMPESQIFMIVESSNRPNEARVRVTTQLDYETDRHTYTLSITATERGTGLSSSVQLFVQLDDLNDNSPNFDIAQYAAAESFPEDVAVGTEIIRVRATDADPPDGINGNITYSLEAETDMELPFSVESVHEGAFYDGVIKVAGSLDFEEIDDNRYTFRVIATDGGVPPRSSVASVKVTVNNTNDEAPQFASRRLQRIESTKSVDSVVTTVFASDPDGDRVTYAFVSSVPSNPPFKIEASSGSIILTEALTQSKYEDISSFQLNVSATDDGSCCPLDARVGQNVGYAIVIIEIVGRNNAPEFTSCSSYNSIAMAPENTIDAFVIQVVAADADVGPNGELKYTLVVNDVSVFKIDEQTGKIYTKEPIDRERTNQLTITVKAEDGASSTLSAFCTFTMTVLDLNDNGPTLSLPQSQDVPVDLAAGSDIYTVFAVDPDYDINGTAGLTYSVIGNSNFKMDGNVLKNKVALSLSLPTTQTMTILVRDRWNLTESSSFTVNIRQSAQPPTFTKVPPSDFKILENLTDDQIIARIKAQSATGGPVNYFLVPTTTHNAFHMLTDNDDCNNNNELCLAIYQSQNLDADKLRFYQLRVRVTPQGPSSVVAEKAIPIELIDVNDNIPEFENKNENGYILGSVDENTTVINTQVVQLQANDSDITPLYKTQTYSLEPGLDSELFSVDATSGVVLVATDVKFDRENRTRYSIKVKATDGAVSARPNSNGMHNSKIATVQINVNDINDNPPYFPQQQYTGQVEETAPKGKRIINIRANDSDIENNFQYTFVSGNDNQAFEITTTGDVLVFDSGRLDYETKKVYNMNVEVSDGRYQARTNVQIRLLDMNDNVPEFSQRVYRVNDVTEEDSSISTSNRLPIVVVSATDADVDRPNNIQYALSGSFSDRFQIDPTSGQVYLVRSLDRDDQPQWDVNVLANDEPGSPTNRIGYAIISVFPKDINDNYPVFIEDTLTAAVEENGTKGEQVLTIRAEDKDSGSNGAVKFKLLDSSVSPNIYPDTQYYPYFAVDDNGVVTTLAKFDREQVDRYTLEVVAYDSGTPTALSATATVTITISDVNDNPPKFSPDYYERRVSELAGPLPSIIQVNVLDVDSDAVFDFSLDNEALKQFRIDDNGNIYIREQQRLDYEYFYGKGAAAEIVLKVTVTDGIYSDMATVKITVVDENDETPVFDPASVTVSLLENVAIDSFVHAFNASDRDARDTPRNSQLEYLIQRAASSDFNRYFQVTSTGVVRTQKSLDRETLQTHTVKVLAVDNGFPTRRTGTATLIVTVDDINDNGPRLVTPTVYIDENLPVSSFTRPREIRAVDDDDNKIGHGPPFKMSPTNGSQNSRDFSFLFHPDWDVPSGLSVANGAGELSSKRVLDREGDQGAEIGFYLELTDKQDLSATRLLTVVVADEDDNPPSPGRRDALVYNYKGRYERVEIGDCYAEDKDDWDKPYKSYEKVDLWPTGFSMDAVSGMISADLTLITSGEYSFKCKVIDNYISDPACSFDCNVAGGTDTQVIACKDKCRVMAEAISDVYATIKNIAEEPVWNGASIRLTGTADEFMQSKSNGKSAYNIFIERMAVALNTDPTNIDVFSVLDSDQPSFVDIRYTAHGSPFYNSTKLIGAVLDDVGLQEALGMTIAQVPINECMKEVCARGCTNTLVISNEPTLVNANGSSIVAVTSRIEAKCGCGLDDGSEVLTCTADSCLHGGLCLYNRDSKTTSCQCPPLFDGPRCQQLRHSFTGGGWAEYESLSQCANGTTAIEFLTSQSDAMLLYNGPNAYPGIGADAITDYLLIAIADGKPEVYINYGTGHVKLSINSIVNDGNWHRLELVTVDRLVTVTLDDCGDAPVPDSDSSNVELVRTNCQASKYTPGENLLLNVNTLLQLGGRSSGAGSWWPSEVSSQSRASYDGCLRSLQHNGQIYDLYVGQVGRHSNSQDGCPREDSVCLDSNGAPVCGPNALCEATLGGEFSCTCKPGWRGENCDIATGYMDFLKESFVEWKVSSDCLASPRCLKDGYRTDIQLSFRSRDIDNNGLLFYVKGNNGAEYIKLMIVGGQLQLRYDIGSDSIDVAQREQVVVLPVIVTDGALHTVVLTRVGRRFTLYMDGGEDRNSIQHEDVYSHQLFTPDGFFYSGADGLYITSGVGITPSTDLDNTCVTDIRFNGKWLASKEADNSLTDIAIVRRLNVLEGCTSDGCSNVRCPGLQQCTDLWRDYECRCPQGYITLYTDPFCEDVDECFPDNPCVHGTCVNLPGTLRCDCDKESSTGKLYTGTFCSATPSASKLQLASSGIAALLVSLLLVLLISLAIFCYVTRRSNMEKDETLIDSYNDIRETIYNYDEEGMPEEDQDGYDISRLSKPLAPDVIQPTFDNPLSRAPPSLMDQPPDVGDFISGRLNDADGDPTNCPGDELNEYAYEGAGSNAGTLSSLNTGSSGTDQDFDYLNDLGPKFGRLADMYGGGDES